MTDADLVMERLTWNDQDAVLLVDTDNDRLSINRRNVVEMFNKPNYGTASIIFRKAKARNGTVEVVAPFAIGNRVIRTQEQLENLAEQFFESEGELEKEFAENTKHQRFLLGVRRLKLNQFLSARIKDFLATK